MFFRLKTSGPRRYLQIVENRREGGTVRQQVIATLGRLDELTASGGLAALLASGARFCEQALLLAALGNPEHEPRLQTRRIGAPLVFGRLWQETGWLPGGDRGAARRPRLRLFGRAGDLHRRPAPDHDLGLRPRLREVVGRLRHPRC
ncbi:MAG TPA: hypothetical protein VM712_03225 [Gaiellales bacterium]|nr:hypothetical protein [Gaiellales bacterium]